MATHRLVTLLNCPDVIQAEFLKSFLNSQGIHADLSNNRPGWTGRYGSISRGVRVQVPAEELAQAKILIKQADSGAFALSEEELLEAADLESSPPPDAPYCPTQCPGCGGPHVFQVQRSGWAYRLFNLCFLGLPWLLSPTTWGCSDCGWEWTRQDIEDEAPEDEPPTRQEP